MTGRLLVCILRLCSFFFQAEDGIRDLVRSRGLGDVYKRQVPDIPVEFEFLPLEEGAVVPDEPAELVFEGEVPKLSLIHI